MELGRMMIELGACFERAFPGGFRCPDWARAEVRLDGKCATVRFYSFYDGHVFGREVRLANVFERNDPKMLQWETEAALENLRSTLQCRGAPVPMEVYRFGSKPCE